MLSNIKNIWASIFARKPEKIGLDAYLEKQEIHTLTDLEHHIALYERNQHRHIGIYTNQSPLTVWK